MDEDPAFLLSQARKCRSLARGIDDQRTYETLTQLAEEYESQAREIAHLRVNLPPDG